MTIFGKWGYKRLGGKKGLTLIELLIVLVILAILAGVIVLAVGGIFGRTGEQAYNLVRDEIQLAVTGYATNVSHDDPVMTGNLSNIDVCLLIGDLELLREIPDGVRDANNGNTSGTVPCVTSDDNHYIWTYNDGNVGSVCVNVAGSPCNVPGGDGYQGQWP
jgi:prepilin-type N-terminal cleavage/methylation domain-containing protein